VEWVVIFEESPGMGELRRQYERDHLAYLRANSAEILRAGGLRDGPDSPFSGGLWVLAPMSRERAIQLIEQEPYFVRSRRSYKLFQWGKAFPEISATI
jgi:uncharacterized protein